MNFKRKAHEVQAIRWTGENYGEVYTWVMSWDLSDPGIHRLDAENCIVVTANLVETTVEVGNWIVRDIDNEFFYPASDDEFAKGYEAT
jgi:hypothetical protein